METPTRSLAKATCPPPPKKKPKPYKTFFREPEGDVSPTQFIPIHPTRKMGDTIAASVHQMGLSDVIATTIEPTCDRMVMLYTRKDGTTFIQEGFRQPEEPFEFAEMLSGLGEVQTFNN